MTNKIIIDGWNVAWKIPEISKYIPENLTQARTLLNHRIKSYYQLKNVILKIIYDGKAGIIQHNNSNKKVDIRFSKDPEKADHLIIKFLKRETKPSDWTVVTSDRELSTRVKNAGSHVISTESYLMRLKLMAQDSKEDPKKNNPTLSKDELDYWLDIFKD
jgi:predicted RNA-binding protein with PIN domain